MKKLIFISLFLISTIVYMAYYAPHYICFDCSDFRIQLASNSEFVGSLPPEWESSFGNRNARFWSNYKGGSDVGVWIWILPEPRMDVDEILQYLSQEIPNSDDVTFEFIEYPVSGSWEYENIEPSYLYVDSEWPRYYEFYVLSLNSTDVLVAPYRLVSTKSNSQEFRDVQFVLNSLQVSIVEDE